jgi:hypothetical protein
MSNIKTVVEEWSVRDLEDGSSINIQVLSCTELGNQSKPGVQVVFMGRIVNYEPLSVERWAYQATKNGVTEYLLEEHSWTANEDQYVKNFLLLGNPLKVRVEVKSRSSKPVVKEYPLPFEI